MPVHAGSNSDDSAPTRRPALLASLLAAAFLAALLAAGGSCAESNAECRVHSDCRRPGRCEEARCVWNCRQDIDCVAPGWCDDLGFCNFGPRPDADADADVPAEAEAEAGADVDVPAEAEAEAGADADAGGGAYLDPCAGHADCTERHCLEDAFWGESTCTRECTSGSSGGCANEHFCVQVDASLAICADAHMGLPCNPADPTANACAYGCVGVAGGGAHCTRPCTSAADCPGGFACGMVNPSVPADGKACMQLNIPCPSASGNECPSGVGACGGGAGSGSWCSAPCLSAADCPRLGAGVPGYTCALDSGVGFSVCQLNDLMLPFIGESGLGTPCATNTDCRSGMCATDGTSSGPYCIELCSVRGGCPHGFGCAPFRTSSGGSYSLFCVSAGSRGLGESCANGADCRSGYCDTSHCTRICNDGFCPSGMTSSATGITADGTAIRVCR